MWEFPYGSHSDRFELWLGRGKPLSPYLKGLLVSHLLAELRPRDLKLAPDELYPSEGVNEMTERTLIRNWLSQWLKYVHWYWSIASRPDANLQEYLEGPVIERSRKMKSINPSVEIVRFGLVWKLFDMCAGKGMEWMVPILPEKLDNISYPPHYLLGGIDGRAFMVLRVGLVPPHYGKGVVN